MANRKQPTPPTEKTPSPVETIIPPKADVLELGPIEINSFKGIDKSKPVVVDLGQHKMAVLKGGQGKRKTSTLEAIQYAFAQEFDFKQANFVNKVDNTINIHHTFKKNGRTYQVHATKTKFELLKKFTAQEEPDVVQWQAMDSPKDMLRKIIGHVATSPMWLKEAKGEDQVKWVYEILKVPAEIKEREVKLQEALKEATDGRKDANKEYTRIYSALSQNQMYLKWEESEALYSKEKKIDEVKARWDAAVKKNNDYTVAKNGLKALKNDAEAKTEYIAEIKEQIAALQLKLEDANVGLISINKRIEKGEKHIAENKGAAADFENVNKEYQDINTFIFNRNKWLETVQLKKDMDAFQTAVVDLDAKKTNLSTDLKNLTKEVLPPIEGFEIETEKNIDAKREVGIYLDDKTPAQLSESELWTLYLMLIRSQGVSMIFAENLSVFGVQAITLLNEMAKDGSIIFGTLADQTTNDMGILLKDELFIKTTIE